jgi:hypothetical protein
VAFSAISIVYVWLIQRKRGRLSTIEAPCGDDELLQKAELVQKHFADVVELNAPSLRYNVVLEELQQEVRRTYAQIIRSSIARVAEMEEQMHFSGEGGIRSTLEPGRTQGSFPQEETLLPIDGVDFDFPLDPNLWSQLDAFPFCEYLNNIKSFFMHAY